jgi:hypothetical protein
VDAIVEEVMVGDFPPPPPLGADAAPTVGDLVMVVEGVGA